MKLMLVGYAARGKTTLLQKISEKGQRGVQENWALQRYCNYIAYYVTYIHAIFVVVIKFRMFLPVESWSAVGTAEVNVPTSQLLVLW